MVRCDNDFGVVVHIIFPQIVKPFPQKFHGHKVDMVVRPLAGSIHIQDASVYIVGVCMFLIIGCIEFLVIYICPWIIFRKPHKCRAMGQIIFHHSEIVL